MIVAQFAIPLAAGVAALLAAGLALHVLLRTRADEAVAEAAGDSRTQTGSFLWRFAALSVTAAMLAGAGFGAAVAVYREGAEAGVLAGLAVVAGALAATGIAAAGAALGQRASERAATAAGHSLRQALAITLRGGTAPALAGGALAIAGVGGLYGVATRLAGVHGAEAAFLTLGAGVGAALTAFTARLLAASEQATDGEEAAAGGAETLALMATGAAAGFVLGVPIAALTDSSAWLVTPIVVMAFGLAAATVSAIALPLWTRALRNAGRAVGAGYWTAAPIAGGLAFATPLVLLDEGRWWFAGAALTGTAMSALVFIAGRTIIGDGSSYRGRGAAFAVLAGAALTAAFVFGRQVEIAGVSPAATALYGVALAAAGALALAPATSAIRWFGAGAANAIALAERAREAAPPPEGADEAQEETEPLPPGPLLATAQRALAPAWTHGFAWTALVGAVALAALLLAVRTELGNVAADDVPRYVQLAAELGVTPRSEAIEAQAAYELTAYLDLLDRHDVAAADRPTLLLASEEATRRVLELRVGAGELDDEALRAIAGSPWPFPPLPPLRLDGMAAVGALLGLAALLGAIGITEAGQRQAAARTAAALLTAAALPLAGAFIAGLAAGGNAGWELAAGAALAALVMGLTLAARGGDRGETGLALTVWLGTAAAVIAPALAAA